jgi:hypothetical protein
MQHIGKSKIGKLSAKGIDYLQLRLPKLVLMPWVRLLVFMRLNTKECKRSSL